MGLRQGCYTCIAYASVYFLATLLANTRELDPTKPVVAASFVNIDDLSESSLPIR